jgi:predicted membrane protein
MTIFAALQALDVYLTLLIISLGGYEANPLMERLVRAGPIMGLLLGKLIAFGVFLLLERHRPQGIRKIQIFYLGVVTWNLAIVALA